MSYDGEERLKNSFIKLMKPHFHIEQEVKGIDLVHGESVRIDFLLYPLRAIREAGFDPFWFGVEVKHFSDVATTKKIESTIRQAMSYQQTVFFGKTVLIRTAFSLLFTNIGSDKLFDTLVHFAHTYNVGNIEHHRYGWNFKFAGASSYFSYQFKDKRYHKGGVDNLGVQVYSGNSINGKGLTTRYADQNEVFAVFDRIQEAIKRYRQ